MRIMLSLAGRDTRSIGLHVVSMAREDLPGAGDDAAASVSRRDCERAFDAADEEGKGLLTREDYKVAVMSLLGYKPSTYELNSVWKSRCRGEGAGLGENCSRGPQGGGSGLDRKAFVELMVDRLNNQDRDELIRQIFLTFDPHCRGFITMGACRTAFQQVASHIGMGELEEFFSEVDGNCDGKISYRDFELMMKHFQLVRPTS